MGREIIGGRIEKVYEWAKQGGKERVRESERVDEWRLERGMWVSGVIMERGVYTWLSA